MGKALVTRMTAAAALLATATPSLAWDELGTRRVRDGLDHDTIALPGKRRFDRIRICVYERQVHFIDVKVRYANGGVQDVPVRARIKPGKCTRAIDLKGKNRNIAAVDFTYEADTRRRGVGARIRLFGK